MVSDPKKQSSFGIFGWSNYSAAGLAFLGLLTLFPALRRLTGYLVLVLILSGLGIGAKDFYFDPIRSNEISLSLVAFGGAAILFFPFWLPSVFLAWVGRKAMSRVAELVDQSSGCVEADVAQPRQLGARRSRGSH